MHRGYTLIETAVVIAVMATLGLIAFFGLGAAWENEKLANAQKELLSELRSSQNSVLAGKNVGTTNIAYSIYDFTSGSSQYTVTDYSKSGPPSIASRTVDLTLISSNLTISPTTSVCFYNPNLTINPCSNATATITITNSANGTSKQVQVDVSANQVTRVYVP